MATNAGPTARREPCAAERYTVSGPGPSPVSTDPPRRPPFAPPGAGAAPAAAVVDDRALWIAQRMNEMPKYVLFLYNLLLDMNIDWRYKEHSFGALRYIFEEDGIIPDDDPLLGRLDDLAFTFRCFAQLIGSLPEGKLAIYEQVLAADAIPIRQHMADAPKKLGDFFFAVSALYSQTIERLRDKLGNAIKTGELVRALQHYIDTFTPDDPTSTKMERCVVFLDSYKLKT
jgi:hypothetical protein